MDMRCLIASVVTQCTAQSCALTNISWDRLEEQLGVTAFAIQIIVFTEMVLLPLFLLSLFKPNSNCVTFFLISFAVRITVSS